MPTRQGGSLAKKASTSARPSLRRTTARPPASTPCTWKTRLARSRPTVVISMADGSFQLVAPTAASLAHRCRSGAVHRISLGHGSHPCSGSGRRRGVAAPLPGRRSSGRQGNTYNNTGRSASEYSSLVRIFLAKNEYVSIGRAACESIDKIDIVILLSILLLLYLPHTVPCSTCAGGGGLILAGVPRPDRSTEPSRAAEAKGGRRPGAEPRAAAPGGEHGEHPPFGRSEHGGTLRRVGAGRWVAGSVHRRGAAGARARPRRTVREERSPLRGVRDPARRWVTRCLRLPRGGHGSQTHS